MTDSADAFAYAFPGGAKYTCPKCGKRVAEFKDNECLKCTIDAIQDTVINATGMPPGMGSTGSSKGFTYEDLLRANRTFRRQAEPEPQTWWERDRARKPPPEPPKPKVAAAGKFDLDAEMLRRLIQLCHPDKHANSPASQKATHFLLDIKAALDKAK